MTVAALAGALFAPCIAHAEPSAWVGLGGGVLAWRDLQSTGVTVNARRGVPNLDPNSVATIDLGAIPVQEMTDFEIDPVLRFEVGIGMPDRYPIIAGGLFRVTPLLTSNKGADISWLARFCTRGFQVGGFGVALDVGAYARTWGRTSQGFEGSLSFGAPLGFAASFNMMAGSRDLLAFGGTVSIDILRLTLYRKTFLNWWPNPEVNTHKPPPQAATPGALFF